MNGRGVVVSVLFVAAMIDVAAQSSRVKHRDSSWTAPAQEAVHANPLADRPEAAAGGRKLFGERCATCHGDDGRGTDRGPDLTTADVQAQTDGTLFWKISSGNTRGGMPAFSFLPKPQRWQLVLHVRTLRSEPTR